MRLHVVTALAAISMLSAGPVLAQSPVLAVGAQYDTAHVYVAPGDMAGLATAFTATFGGHAGAPAVTTVTPTSSTTRWQAIQTPAGSISVFGFTTPIPYPFGAERTGYMVTNMAAAIAEAKAAGADVLVEPFADPIGQDAIIQWPGGVDMQLYSHNAPPSSPALQTIPENRIYVSPGRAELFLKAFLTFSHGQIIQDDAQAPGAAIGRPGYLYRQVRVASDFGRLTVLVTDGHLPFPYGREVTGYEVADLKTTLAKATAAGVTILAGPLRAAGRDAAIVEFPGGYVAEVHASPRQ